MKLRNKKTGEIGTLIVDGAYKFVTNFAIEDDDGNRLGEYNSLAELNEEWEDAPEESKSWWYIDCNGEVFRGENADKEHTDEHKSIGNYYTSSKEAEKAVKKLKAWKRLRDKNFHFLKYSALGCGEIEFSLDFEDMDDEGEIGELRHDLDLLFGGEE